MNDKECAILVVEDNEKMRMLIQSFLQTTYTVLLAENGKEGFEVAQKELPDLILSDVAMPDMDGLAFCRKIKTNLETAHIPVLMITAKTLEQDQLAGYESGASDYILKPFNVAILKMKIKNILDSVRSLRAKFSIEKNNFEEYTSNNEDAALMKKVMAFFATHYQNSDLSIDLLNQEMGLSRSSLYRKLKSITGKSPVDLLQMFRLQKAHDLLLHSSLNVSEIAYAVGYTDPGYFSTRFKEFYQTHPTALLQKRKNSDVARST